MKLLGSKASPFVRKVRVVMNEKKIDYQFVVEDVWAVDTLIAQTNPLGKVPCLVLEDGSAMYDSRVIVEYVDTLTPVGKLIPSNGRERAEVKRWEALADGILDAAILARLERTWGGRKAGERSEAWVKHQMQKVENGLKMISSGLSDHQFCVDNHYTLADIAVGCALGWISFRFPEINWRVQYINLARLMDRLSERQAFKDTVPVA